MRKHKMKELKEFLIENKNSIHSLLNHMWRTIERIAIKLEDAIPDVDLDNSHGNYIKIENGWEEGTYANPSIVFPFGELGYSLDGLFCVFSIDPKKITVDSLARIIGFSRENEAVFFEMYGADDCFQTFFSSKDEGDIDDILLALENTEEEFIQLDLGIEAFASDDLIDAFVELAVIIYNYLNESNLLALIPTNE